jgi:hypothetical protein
MIPSTVQEILRRIEELSEEDRLLLEQRLAQLAESEWKREFDSYRQTARARGLDQAAIDHALEKLRYPS